MVLELIPAAIGWEVEPGQAAGLLQASIHMIFTDFMGWWGQPESSIKQWCNEMLKADSYLCLFKGCVPPHRGFQLSFDCL